MSKVQRSNTALRRDSTASAELRLREFHTLGTAALKATNVPDGKYTPGVIKDQAEELACSEQLLYKARQFSGLYSASDLDQLCLLRMPNGKPLGIGHVCQLILVKDRSKRIRLQKATAKHGWSSRELEAKRKQLFGTDAKARKAGRKPRSPTNVEEALHQLAEMSDHWLRWARELEVDQAGKHERVNLKDLPTNVRSGLSKATNIISKLAESVDRSQAKRIA